MPVRLPNSYGPGPLVGITGCCDHMHTGLQWVICVFFCHGVGEIPYVYLTGSVRFMCGHPKVPCRFHTGMGTSVRSVLMELYGPVRMPCGLGNICTIGGEGPYGDR